MSTAVDASSAEGRRRYDIHSLVTLSVDLRTPGASVIDENFTAFRRGSAPEDALDASGAAHIEIRSSPDEALDAAGIDRRDGRRGPGFTYGPGWFVLDRPHLAVARSHDGLTVGSATNVDRFALTLIDWLATEAGAPLVHAGAVAFDGGAVLIAGWGGVGKTSTLATLCRRPGARFLADDMAFIDGGSTVRALPKPMYIYPYHRDVFPELFAGRHKPLVPRALAPVVEQARTVARPLVARSPRVENLARRLTPEHMKTAPEVAMPGLDVVEDAPLGLVVRLERSIGLGAPRVSEMDGAELLHGLVQEFVHEVSDATSWTLPIAATSGLVQPLERWLSRRRSSLEPVTSSAPGLRIELPLGTDATTTSSLVTSVVSEHLG